MAAQGRGFWLHQLVEYGIAGGLIMMSAQSQSPAVPIALGIALLVNAAIADGGVSAFKWVSRRVHRYIDWLIIVLCFVAAAVADLDSIGRLALIALGLVEAIIVLGTNFDKKPPREQRTRRLNPKGDR